MTRLTCIPKRNLVLKLVFFLNWLVNQELWIFVLADADTQTMLYQCSAGPSGGQICLQLTHNVNFSWFSKMLRKLEYSEKREQFRLNHMNDLIDVIFTNPFPKMALGGRRYAPEVRWVLCSCIVLALFLLFSCSVLALFILCSYSVLTLFLLFSCSFLALHVQL